MQRDVIADLNRANAGMGTSGKWREMRWPYDVVTVILGETGAGDEMARCSLAI